MSEREPKSLAELVESQKALRIERMSATGTSTGDTASNTTDFMKQYKWNGSTGTQWNWNYDQMAASQRQANQLAAHQQSNFWNPGYSKYFGTISSLSAYSSEQTVTLESWIAQQKRRYWRSCYRTISQIELLYLQDKGLNFKVIEMADAYNYLTVKELPTENIFRRMMMLFFSRRFLELEAKKKSLELDIAALAQQLELTKKKYDMDLLEAKTLISLESEQRIAKINLESQKRVQQLEMENSVKLSELKSGLAKEYYDKMQIAMKDLTLQGSDQSRFVQELSLKMMDKALEKPMPAHYIKEKRVKLKAKNDE